MSEQINIIQRGKSYFVRRQTKGFWGTKTEYLSLFWLPNIDWRTTLDAPCVTQILEQAEQAYDIVLSGDKVIR